MRKKKVLAVTGIRSEYDILYPVLKELCASNFQVKIVASGDTISKNINLYFLLMILVLEHKNH